MNPFHLRPAAEAIGILLAAHAVLGVGIFAMWVVILARLM
jgi:hypothetical protein